MGCTSSSNNKVNIKPDTKLEINAKFNKNFVLGIIDTQNDFFCTGSLAVPNANDIIGPINKLRYELGDGMNTFFSMDTHPPNHISFGATHQIEPFKKIKLKSMMANRDVVETEQELWPVHCVYGTFGNQIHPHIITNPRDWIIKKGSIHNVESYSAFGDENDNKYENTGLNNVLKSVKCTNIILVGLAMDYCVYNTALDALKYGYAVHIILSCVRGVNEKTTINSIKDLKSRGVYFYSDIKDFILYSLVYNE